MRILTAALLVATYLAAPARAQVAGLVSRNSAGEAADSHSYRPSISSDGRWVAFDSWASNLAVGLDVSNSGVFVRDVLGGTTLASTSDAGAIPNGKSYMADISGDGRFVAFWSQASNLVADDTNGEEDLFVYDRTTRTVSRANVSAAGIQADPADNDAHIVGDPPSISADGRYVAFDSRAPNLVTGDTNGVSDVFVKDRETGTITRISLESGGTEALSPSDAPAISADGRYVAFRSLAALTPDDLDGGFDVYLYDRVGSTLARVGNTFGSGPAISGDGRFVAFESSATDLVPGDTNGKADVFVFDRQTAVIERVSVASGGAEGDGDSSEPAISQDGRWVAFRSAATTLIASDTNGNDDIFLRDRQSATTTRISVRPDGIASNGFSRLPAISADGSFLAFESAATNLAPDDDFGAVDVFLGVREDTCPGDPAKVFPGVCGCGTPDVDADHDGAFGCTDTCPDDPQKTAPGTCGCGTSDADSDGDGIPDCHDPNTAAGLADLARTARLLAKQLKVRAPDRDQRLAELGAYGGYLTATLDNDAFSANQKRLIGSAARTLTDLAKATGKAIVGKKRKAVRVLGKLLKASGG